MRKAGSGTRVEGGVKHLGWTIGAALLLAAGCDATHHARLDDGAGLAEGSPVIVSSVRVGQVESVRVQEGHVDVEFAIDSDHEVTLRADACALARRTEAGSELLVVPGTGAALEEDRPIPQCEITSDDLGGVLRSLGEGVNDMLRQLGQGLFGPPGSGGGSSAPLPLPIPSPGGGSSAPLPLPIPSLPGPGSPSAPAPAASSVCDSLRVRVERTEVAPPVPLHLPSGGHRVFLEIANDSDRPARVGALGDATFTDPSGRVLDVAEVPGETEAWFMPFTVPAGARRSVSVTFAGAEPPRIDRVEVQHTAPEERPLDYCVLRASGLAAR